MLSLKLGSVGRILMSFETVSQYFGPHTTLMHFPQTVALWKMRLRDQKKDCFSKRRVSESSSIFGGLRQNREIIHNFMDDFDHIRNFMLHCA